MSIKKKLLALAVASAMAATAVPFVSAANKLGDVNSDSNVNSQDALAVLRYSVGYEDENFYHWVADINADGNINSSDALEILKISVGLSSNDPANYSKGQIIQMLNEATYEQYYGKVKIESTVTNTGSCQYNLDGEVEEYTFDPESAAFSNVFIDGVLEGYDEMDEGSALEEYAFVTYFRHYDLNNYIKDATIKKSGDGYRIDVTLAPETDDLGDLYPEANDSLGLVADLESIVYEIEDAFETFSCEDAVAKYSKTTLTVITDSLGRATYMEINAPMDFSFKLYSSEYDANLKYTQNEKFTYKANITYM